MKYNNGCDEYHLRKMALLKQMLRINEEFLSTIEDWEAYDVHLSKREEILKNIARLNNGPGAGAIESCSDSQKRDVTNMVNLILALDDDIITRINEGRSETLEFMRNNAVSKKITGYGYNGPEGQSGKFLDYRE